MRKVLGLLVLVSVVMSVAPATPARAAPKKLTSTIMFPGSDVGTWFGAGYGNFIGTAKEDLSDVRQSCPTAGPYDGYIWRFFDLKGKYTRVTASGPKPLFEQNTPVWVMHDYDIDLYLFDDKCKRVQGGTNGGGGIEKQRTKKPVSYAVVVYWDGHEPNLPVTLELS